jgi:hypothetical protein
MYKDSFRRLRKRGGKYGGCCEGKDSEKDWR